MLHILLRINQQLKDDSITHLHFNMFRYGTWSNRKAAPLKSGSYKKNNSTLFQNIVIAIFTVLGLGSLVVWIHQLSHQWRIKRKLQSDEKVGFKLSHHGIITVDVDSRRTDEVCKARDLAEKAAKKERWSKNIFSIFNVTILVLAVSQILLNDPLGAILTIGTLILNVSINIFQETRAAKQVGALANFTRPMAAVIRDGRLQSIDQDEIVVGDVLVAGRGDEILANGILLESANLKIKDTNNTKNETIGTLQAGARLTAGTYCEAGWVVYQVSRLNVQVPEDEDPAKMVASIRIKTPLQKIIERVLYVLLVIVAIFYVFIFLEVIRFDLLPPELMTSYREVMSIIFSILPSGLLLMIVINYAVGSADIARSDVLVHNSQTIESLAQVSSVGFIRHGGAMGLTIDLEMLPLPENIEKLSERRVRLALGNYIHSIREEQYPLSIIKDHLDGEPRSIDQQARYLSLYGWEAMTFSSADMPGSYVVGYQEDLAPYLLKTEPFHQAPSSPFQPKENSSNFASRLRRLFGKAQNNKKQDIIENGEVSLDHAAKSNIIQGQFHAINKTKGKGFIKGFRQRISAVFRRRSKMGLEKEAGGEVKIEKIRGLIFAYSPKKQPIHKSGYHPQCPQDLLPLCRIKFIDEIRPEVRYAVKKFKEEGIAIKIFTEGEPVNSLELANLLGLTEIDSEDSLVITGDELDQMLKTDYQANITDKIIFAKMHTDQMIQIIQILQSQGEQVAVLGTSIKDIPIMQSANLSITSKSSSPTVLHQADLIVLKNSFNALTQALQKGQRIVNSVMDVLKLNLTRIGTTLILILAMYALGERTFFYHPAQGATINIFTVLLPSIALSLWTSPKAVDGQNIPRLLIHFIFPAALLSALSVFLIRFLFLRFNGDAIYAQLGVTHALVLIGLALVLFAQPPVRFLVAGDDFSGRWQPPLAILAFYIIFNLLTLIPLAQRLLRLKPLQTLWDYLIIFTVTLIWAFLLIVIWRLLWPERFRSDAAKHENGPAKIIKES